MIPQEIISRIDNITNEIILREKWDHLPDVTLQEKLTLILDESLQALDLVASIEDEFGIALNDEEIDLGFFMNLDIMVDRISKHL
jgi:acyl carrier protein